LKVLLMLNSIPSQTERLLLSDKLLALDDDYSEDVKTYLGESAFEEYVQIAQHVVSRLGEKHLGLRAPTNLIFVPGVMGSLLESRTLGGVWWIDVRTRKHLNDLQLSADGLEDANANYQIAPSNVDTSYEPFLAAVLERDDFGHVVFPYDWRKPLSLSTAALRNKVLEIHEENGNEPVHLVAHSMGGLAVRATLMEYGTELWPILGRIVFIGTPHYGSPAIAGYLKNHLWGFDLMAILGLYISRETFRSLWGVLSMLPAPRGLYPGTRKEELPLWDSGQSVDPYVHPCANFDLYQVESWKLGLSSEQASRLQQVLDGVAEFHRKMYQAHRKLDQGLRDRMAVIAGVGYKSLFRLAYHPGFLGLWEHMDKVTTRIQGDAHREGDGRVPLASAALENVGEIRFIKGVHGGLPMISQVYEDVFHWLKYENMQLPATPAEALSRHLGGEIGSSEAPHLDGTARANATSGDPGYWELKEPDPASLVEMERKLDVGELAEFITVRLL
jgi:pimeloyl-ACP methyl ester carboxylesterase